MKLFLLYLFSALIAAANSLECSCTAGTEGCKSETCITDDGGYCVSEVWNHSTTQDSKITLPNFKGCVAKKPFDVCKEGDFVFTAGEKFTWNSACCNKKKCNANTTAVNTTTTTRKVCPTCFVFDSKPCNGTKRNCAVSQDYCLTISGEFHKGSNTEAFFGQGCATPSAKVLVDGAEMKFGDITILINASHIEKAKDGASRISGSIGFAVLLPYLFGLLLDKFLF